MSDMTETPQDLLARQRPPARPGLIREAIKLTCIIGLALFFYGVTP